MKVWNVLLFLILGCVIFTADIFVSQACAAPVRGRRNDRYQTSPRIRKALNKFATVTVDGSGETLAQARQDAKKNALSAVVGRALKEKTNILEVGDDVTVTSEFIAASAGLIANYKELSRKKENDVFAVKAQVTVYREKLYESIVFGPDTKKSVDIELGSDLETAREEMTQYIVSYLIDYCRIWSLQVKDIIHEYDNNGKPVLYANCYLGTTPVRYSLYVKRLEAALKRVGFNQADYNYDLNKDFSAIRVLRSPDNTPYAHNRSAWIWFWGPKKYMEAVRVYEDELDKYGYKVTFEMLSEDDEVIATSVIGRNFSSFYSNVPAPEWRDGSYSLRHLQGKTHSSAAYRQKMLFKFSGFTSADDMLKVKKIRTKIKPVKKVREKTLAFPGNWVQNLTFGKWYEY